MDLISLTNVVFFHYFLFNEHIDDEYFSHL